jgi:hypothetical protein
MALINEEVQVQQPPSEIPSPEPPRRHASTARVALGWAAVVAAAAAVSVLTVAVFSTEDEPASPVWTGDAKDHPLYRQPATAERQPVAAPTASPVWTGDAKDHPLYRRSAAG